MKLIGVRLPELKTPVIQSKVGRNTSLFYYYCFINNPSVAFHFMQYKIQKTEHGLKAPERCRNCLYFLPYLTGLSFPIFL